LEIKLVNITNKTLYTSPYLVVNDQEYTKHFYAESQRLASKLGVGLASSVVDPLSYQVGEITSSYENKRDSLSDLLERGWSRTAVGSADIEAGNVSIESTEFNVINELAESSANEPESDLYFYHSDHLGSSSWITSASGAVDQHLQYLPFATPKAFGDIYQRSSSWDVPYTFSGKEKDSETGYSYFPPKGALTGGARYYDSDLSVWLSVDPMASMFPSQSGYAYVSNNPINLIDPFGLSPDDPPAGANPDEYSSGGNTTMPKGTDPSLEPETPQGYYSGNGKQIPYYKDGTTSNYHEPAAEYTISIWIHHGREGVDMGGKFGGHTMISFGGNETYGFTGNYGVRETSNGYVWDSRIHGSDYYGNVNLIQAGKIYVPVEGHNTIQDAGLWTRIDINVTPQQYYSIKKFYQDNLGKPIFRFHILWGQNCSKSAFNVLKDYGVISGSAFFHALTPGMFNRFLIRLGFQSTTITSPGGLSEEDKSIINYNTRKIRKKYGK
jgi:RHS repeat-associated protein